MRAKTELNQILRGKKLILASSSPRRAEILRKQRIDFETICPHNMDEEKISADPVVHVLELSRKKVQSVLHKVQEGLILGADTIVVLNGEILGKPKDRAHAQGILRKLSGKTHRVYTGLTLMDKRSGKISSDHDCTEVTFNELDEEDIKDYIATGEPMDKAGAYGIQGMGSFLVDRIRGNLDNVIGLPMQKFRQILKTITDTTIAEKSHNK